MTLEQKLIQKPTIQKDAESIEDFRSKIKSISASNFPVWELEKLTEFVEFSVRKLSPFQMEDVVELAKTIDIKENSGWYCHKHILVKGRKGIIRDIIWNNGKFNYLWEPENQTWISAQDNIERPIDRPYCFQLSEDNFIKKDLLEKNYTLKSLHNAWEDGAIFALDESLKYNPNTAQIISRNPYFQHMYEETFEFFMNSDMKKEIDKIAVEKQIAPADVVRELINDGINNNVVSNEESELYSGGTALQVETIKNLSEKLDKAKKLLQRAISDFYEEDGSWTIEADRLLGKSARKTYPELMDEILKLNGQIQERDNYIKRTQEKIHNINVKKIDEAVNKACSEPTLLEAFSWIAIWENDRAVKQALKGEKDPFSGSLRETCFLHCFKAVMEQWAKKNTIDNKELF